MDIKIIEEQLKKVPEEIKKLFFSVETAEIIHGIGERNGLMLDQISDLIEEVGLTIIGLKSSGAFIENITKKLNVKRSTATKIAEEINRDILSIIKKEIQDTENKEGSEKPTQTEQPKTNPTPEIASVEKAGDFTIEKHGELPRFEKDATPIPSLSQTNNHTDIIVDHLLSKPNSQPEERVVKPVAKIEKDGVSITAGEEDPYRETF